MKHFSKHSWMLVALLSLACFFSCSDDESFPSETEFKDLVEGKSFKHVNHTLLTKKHGKWVKSDALINGNFDGLGNLHFNDNELYYRIGPKMPMSHLLNDTSLYIKTPFGFDETTRTITSALYFFHLPVIVEQVNESSLVLRTEFEMQDEMLAYRIELKAHPFELSNKRHVFDTWKDAYAYERILEERAEEEKKRMLDSLRAIGEIVDY